MVVVSARGTLRTRGASNSSMSTDRTMRVVPDLGRDVEGGATASSVAGLLQGPLAALRALGPAGTGVVVAEPEAAIPATLYAVVAGIGLLVAERAPHLGHDFLRSTWDRNGEPEGCRDVREGHDGGDRCCDGLALPFGDREGDALEGQKDAHRHDADPKTEGKLLHRFGAPVTMRHGHPHAYLHGDPHERRHGPCRAAAWMTKSTEESAIARVRRAHIQGMSAHGTSRSPGAPRRAVDELPSQPVLYPSRPLDS